MKENFQKRLIELRKQQVTAQMRLQQAHDDVIAISGAIQEVDYWMKQLHNEGGEEQWQDS